MVELDLGRVLHPIQVMFRTLVTVVAPVPDSMVEYKPEIWDKRKVVNLYLAIA